MQNFTQKYTIIQLFEDISEGTQFSSDNWPLHSTLVDTFAIGWNVPTMIRNLEKLLTNMSAATSIVEGDTFFGPNQTIQVALLRKSDSLLKLHNDIVTILQKGDLKLNDPQFAGTGFVPHSTVQNHARLHEGDQVIFDALTIIDMFPDDNPYLRKVLKTIRISQP
ncbi:MAG TPA: 2'-5' RNA ligase family protein [Bacillota bacterium]|nr:2'-5' RNA ligase family protein [Bacillota bacterium]